MPALLRRKLFIAVLIVGLLTPLVGATSVSAAHTYDNGFENADDTDSWFPYRSGDSITRVASGTNGVPSSDGSYHASLDGSVYTWWGESGGETVWPDYGYKTEIDVYLNMSLADGASSQTFQWNSSVNDPNGDFLEEAFFQLRTDPDTANQWNIRMARVYNGFVRTDWFDVTQSGWYTLRHTFYQGDGGLLEIKLEVLNESGTVLGSVVWDGFVDYSVANGDVGGPRYGWFYPQSFTDLPVDSARMEPLPAPLPVVEAVCMNRYNGDVRVPRRPVCSSTEILIEDELPSQLEICVNRYNGALRVTGIGCSWSEINMEPNYVCANRYNGDLRAPRGQRCASTEILHEWGL